MLEIVQFQRLVKFQTSIGSEFQNINSQIVRVQSLLRRGIGVHHAGLLPIVKEVIEMLFCRGVIKVNAWGIIFLALVVLMSF